jgi:transcriptional regulator with XRE-family HTH domain
MAIRDFSAASYVAAQTKNIRRRRRWSQQQLANRLTELLTAPPPENFEPNDPRKREAELRKAATPKWTQARIAKLERGKLKCVSVDDVFELALGLDVSPLVLMTPALPPQEESDAENWSLLRFEPGDVFRMWFGGELVFWPDQVRHWIRGVKPLLWRAYYKSDDEADAGHRYFLFGSQPLAERGWIDEASEYAAQVAQVQRSLETLAPTEREGV